MYLYSFILFYFIYLFIYLFLFFFIYFFFFFIFLFFLTIHVFGCIQKLSTFIKHTFSFQSIAVQRKEEKSKQNAKYCLTMLKGERNLANDIF